MVDNQMSFFLSILSGGDTRFAPYILPEERKIVEPGFVCHLLHTLVVTNTWKHTPTMPSKSVNICKLQGGKTLRVEILFYADESLCSIRKTHWSVE